MKNILRIVLVVIILCTLFLSVIPPHKVLATSTLVIYGSNSDATIYANDAVYANARNATTGTFWWPNRLMIGQWLTGGEYLVHRSSVYFDTSTIPALAEIYSATLSLYGEINNSAQDFNITITNGMPTYPHDPMVEADFDVTNYSGTPPTSGGAFDTVGFATGAYNNITLNATGLTWINKGGQTKFMLMSSRDISSNAPAAGVNEWVSVYSTDGWPANAPKLTITYTANPTVKCISAWTVTSTTAIMRASITDDGGDAGNVQVRFAYGTTSNSAANFLNYDEVTAWGGSYSTGSVPTSTLSGLLKNTTYYYRVQARNVLGVAIDGDVEQTFTTLVDNPNIDCVLASIVSATTAKLNAIVTDDGGEDCTVSWGYGTTTHTAADFALYDVVTAFSGAWSTGEAPYYDATGLIEGTTYYYRVQIDNSAGTTTSIDEQTFTTAAAIDDITSFSGYPDSTSINLSWVLGDGDSNAAIYCNSVPYTDPNPNLIIDGSFDDPVLADWTFVGAGGSAVRSAAQRKTGAFSAAVTRVGFNCSLWQAYAGWAGLVGQHVTAGVWAYATVANRANFNLTDGVNDVTTYHSGAAGWEWLTADFIVDAAAGTLSFSCNLNNGDTTVYFDGAVLMLGTNIPADGTLIYFGSNSNYSHTGLTPGTTYYYIAYGESGDVYSAAGKYLTLTTLGTSVTTLPSGSTLPIPSAIPSLNASPDASRLSRLEPFYSLINNFSSSWGMPQNNMWLAIALIVIAIIGLIILIESRSLVAAIVVVAGLMIGGIAIQILPAWMAIVVVILAVGAWAANHNFG